MVSGVLTMLYSRARYSLNSSSCLRACVLSTPPVRVDNEVGAVRVSCSRAGLVLRLAFVHGVIRQKLDDTVHPQLTVPNNSVRNVCGRPPSVIKKLNRERAIRSKR